MSTKAIRNLVIAVVAVLAIIIGAVTFTERVPEGKVAVVYSPSGGAIKTLDAGWHPIGLFQKTQQYPTRITIVKTKVSVTTSDGKKITLPVRYEYKTDKKQVLEIFKELGSQNIEQIQEGYLYQRLFKASRDVITQYSVLDIYGSKTSEASAKITETMMKSSQQLGFMVTDVTLGSPELDKETQKSIDARVQASQQLEKIKLDKQIAEEEAEKKIIEAKGSAEAQIENARGRAESFRILGESVTPELLKLKEIEARQQHGWVEVQGGNVITDVREK